MAVLFTPQDATKAFYIAGSSSVPSAKNGLAGPFPNIGLTTDIKRQDGVLLGRRTEISIAGIALITNAASAIAKGARQKEMMLLQEEMVMDQATLVNNIGKQGKLEIIAYGGTKTQKFENATLVSISASEQDEASAGIQNQPFTFTFESFSGNSTTGYDTDENCKKDIPAFLESFTESWSVTNNEEYSTGTQLDSEKQQFGSTVRTFSITRELSAQASLNAVKENAKKNGKMGWQQAKSWVESRLIDSPLNADGSFSTDIKDERNNALSLPIPHADDFKMATYNHVRTKDYSIADGSYTVSDTWIASKQAASYSVEYSFNEDPTAEYNTVDVNVNAQGYESAASNAATSTKYTNALSNWANVKSAAINGASAFYSTAGGPGTLRTVIRAGGETHNETEGSLSFNATLDDATINTAGAVSESLNITYDNTDGSVQTVVVIPVLEKANGPVIQDMGVTPEKKVSVTLDLQMDRDNRATKPSADDTVDAYKPDNGYQQSRTETWNPYSGSYSLSKDWVYI